MKVRLYTLRGYHKASGHIHRWHLATPPGYRSFTTDDPASVTWLPLVGQWASVAVNAAGGSGGSRVQVEDLRLINVRPADGLPRYAAVYDETDSAWLRVELGERPLNPLLTGYVVQTITESEVDRDAPLATAVTVWRGKAGIIAPDRTELRLPVHDRMLDFDTPVLARTRVYAGTGGLEGPAEMADVAREMCLGWCPIVAPTYLGFFDDYHWYSTNGGDPIEGVVRGWDKGAVFTKVSGDPAGDEFSADAATGLIRVGGDKPEDFRVEVKGAKVGGVWLRHIGQVIAHLATAAGIVPAADVAGIDATPRTVGLYLPAGDTRTHRAVYDRLVGSVARGRWYIDLADALVVTRLPRPADATPTRTYRRRAGETPGLKPTSRSTTAPAKQVVVRWGENQSPMPQTVAATTAADAALWANQWRDAASALDVTVEAAYGASARTEYVDTALALADDAAAEAPLWLAEQADPPQPYELKVRDGAPGVWIGDAVAVIDDIAGFESGGTVVVTGRTNRDRGGGATLYVEG